MNDNIRESDMKAINGVLKRIVEMTEKADFNHEEMIILSAKLSQYVTTNVTAGFIYTIMNTGDKK